MHVARISSAQPGGYRLVYTSGMTCPGCGGKHWRIGRLMAECGRCEFPVFLPDGDPLRDSFLDTGKVS